MSRAVDRQPGGRLRAVRLLTIREVARLYRKGRDRVTADVNTGALPARRDGRAVLCSARRAEELYGVDGPHALGL